VSEAIKAKKLARSLLDKLSRLAVIKGNKLVLGSLNVSVRYIQYARKGF
jgi:ABC-type uncharacterized transport system permease subunit